LAVDNPNEISFKLYRGYAIVVRGSVGNLKNLNFLIDTGAVPSVLDQRIAQRLHLAGNKEKLSVFTQKVDTERAIAPDVQVGPVRAEALPIVVRDLSFATDALGSRIDAMIGFDFLGHGPFTIDYGSKKIVFGPIDPSLTGIPYEAHPGYALVKLKIQQKSLQLLVDTGASDLVLFASAMSDCQDAIKKIGTRAWSNMGGEIQVDRVQLKDAYLGITSWSVQDVFILPDGGNPPAGLRGLLGVVSLKARRVGFDPDQRIIAWDRASGPVQMAKTAR
jgi:predicted aspartyl protease